MDEPNAQSGTDLIGTSAGVFLSALLAVAAFAPLPVFFGIQNPLYAAAFMVFGVGYFLVYRYFPRYAVLVRVPFFLAFAGYIYCVASLLAVIQPLVFPVAAGLGLLHFFLTRRAGRPLVSVAFVAAIFVLFAATPNLGIRILAVGAFLILPPIVMVGGGRTVPPGLFSAAIATMLCVGWFVAFFYYGLDAGQTARVAAQPGMRMLVDPAGAHGNELLGRAAIFCAKSCDLKRLLVGRDGRLASTRVDSIDCRELIFDGRPGDEVAYECEHDRIWVADYSRGGIVELDGALNRHGWFPAAGRAITNLRRSGSVLLAGDDRSRDGLLFDLSSRSFRREFPAVGSRDLLRDPKTERLIGTTLFRVNWIEPESARIERSRLIPSMQIRMELDTASDDLYVSAFSSGSLYRFDADSGRLKNKLRLHPGIRFVRLVPERSILAVANYATGELYLVGVPDLVLLRTFYVGRRVRALHIAPGDSELTFVSRAGAFALDIAKVFPPSDTPPTAPQ